MIDTMTMERIFRIKRRVRDLARADVAAAEERRQHAEREHLQRQRDTEAAADKLGSVRESSPDMLELEARALVESALAEAQAHGREVTRVSELEVERGRRIDAERDLRGVELARVRLHRRACERTTRAEERVTELWASRRKP